MPVLEICVDSLASAKAAEAGGAHRVELCSGLIEGGLTPSLGLIRAVRNQTSLEVYVMIRPRPGDFVYSAEELAIMREDVRLAMENGAHGVVFGLLTAEGEVDVKPTRELVQLARPMGVTFHRAIDLARDLKQALQDVVVAGADRVLTSGGEANAVLGAQPLHDLVELAAGRISIMAGGSVRPENAREIARRTGVSEFHSALRPTLLPKPVTNERGVHLGEPGVEDRVYASVRVEDVLRLRQAIEDGVKTGD